MITDPHIDQGLNRRDFLRGMSAAALATLAAGEPRPAHAADPVRHPKPTADTLILLWMAGGMRGSASRKSSRRSRPPVSSAASTALLTSRTPTTPPTPSARPRG